MNNLLRRQLTEDIEDRYMVKVRVFVRSSLGKEKIRHKIHMNFMPFYRYCTTSFGEKEVRITEPGKWIRNMSDPNQEECQ